MDQLHQTNLGVGTLPFIVLFVLCGVEPLPLPPGTDLELVFEAISIMHELHSSQPSSYQTVHHMCDAEIECGVYIL